MASKGAADDLPRIFDLFFTTKGANGGSGLGLAISREIVLTHHGEIRVESEPGQGTRFIVSLPRAGEECRGAGEQRSKGAGEQGCGGAEVRGSGGLPC